MDCSLLKQRAEKQLRPGEGMPGIVPVYLEMNQIYGTSKNIVGFLEVTRRTFFISFILKRNKKGSP